MDELKLISDVGLVALTVWREARGEPRQGKLAVAHSIMNRVLAPGWWGSDVPTVVGKAWQYSSLTDPKDPQLVMWPRWDPGWVECLEVARAAVLGTEPHPAPGADSYFAVSIPAPKWADPAKFVAQIGHHRFFNLGRDPA